MNRAKEDQLRDCVLLYVEDDDATAYLFQMALEEAGIQARCFRVTDGAEALDFVLRRGAYTDAPSPDLVILDLNLPKLNGFQVLTEIRGNKATDNLTVAVYSSSTDPQDRSRALDLGADAYLLKGGDFGDFIEAARSACALIPRGPVLKTA